MNNFREWKTTLIGLPLFGLSFAYFFMNIKSLSSLVWSELWVPSVLGILGILLMLAPDKILNLFFKSANKKINGQ